MDPNHLTEFKRDNFHSRQRLQELSDAAVVLFPFLGNGQRKFIGRKSIGPDVGRAINARHAGIDRNRVRLPVARNANLPSIPTGPEIEWDVPDGSVCLNARFVLGSHKRPVAGVCAEPTAKSVEVWAALRPAMAGLPAIYGLSSMRNAGSHNAAREY